MACAAVEAAGSRGACVIVHACPPRALERAIEDGMHGIVHGLLLEDATARLMAEKMICWSLRPLIEAGPVAPARRTEAAARLFEPDPEWSRDGGPASHRRPCAETAQGAGPRVSAGVQPGIAAGPTTRRVAITRALLDLDRLHIRRR